MLSVTAAVPSIPLPALLAKDSRDENHGPQRLAVIERVAEHVARCADAVAVGAPWRCVA